jgi:hypothetical protein
LKTRNFLGFGLTWAYPSEPHIPGFRPRTPDMILADVLDLDAGGHADRLRALANAFAQRFGEPGVVVEYANAWAFRKLVMPCE